MGKESPRQVGLGREVEVDEFADLSVGELLEMTEMAAAVGRCQLAKAESIIDQREAYARRLTAAVSDLPGITPPVVRQGCRHVYYVWVARYDAAMAGVSRQLFAKALRAEGVPIDEGYVKPLYRLPAFQRRVALGNKGFPFDLTDRHYPENLCPVCERMHFHEELGFGICSFELSDRLIDKIARAFHKVFARRDDLRRGIR